MKGLWRPGGVMPALAAAAGSLRRPQLRTYSSAEVPVPITTLTDEEEMMKETGEWVVGPLVVLTQDP